MTHPIIKISVFILILLLGAGGNVWADNESAGLFNDFPGDLAGSKQSPTVVRSRLVSVNFDQIQGKKGSVDPSQFAESLNLNLFPDVSLIAVLNRLEKNPTGSYSWIGHIEGNPFSTVTLVVNDKIIMGNISLLNTMYAIRFSGDFQTHVIQEIDRSRFPRD